MKKPHKRCACAVFLFAIKIYEFLGRFYSKAIDMTDDR